MGFGTNCCCCRIASGITGGCCATSIWEEAEEAEEPYRGVKALPGMLCVKTCVKTPPECTGAEGPGGAAFRLATSSAQLVSRLMACAPSEAAGAGSASFSSWTASRTPSSSSAMLRSLAPVAGGATTTPHVWAQRRDCYVPCDA